MKTENQLLKELFILSARRAIRPSLQDSKAMNELMRQLYELTKDEIYSIQ